ncbi:clamp loader of DNA polymerase [Salmonella phage STML-198]|uniref:Sliding-clamp-loader large subunit n=2 Tax=Gelderlandvirus TaxID=1913653 RepID=K4I5Z9_9CAUD|nr:clamp loader of DNA polymerase [Salmonella phage STML-198]YP_009615528.1 clamp loader of DNA polymerase [Salmonella phage Melville]AFU63995.1 replication factor C small subunit [Salmonella phage STML-198]ATN93016.1 clamp loader subunit [Salmonella phage Melville]UPW42417.1 sliding-clamp-loader subunit [Salmonella phage CF-SP2]
MITINEKEHILEQRYRPSTIEECILPAADRETMNKIVKSGKIPHMILVSASPGTGKTTTAKALCNDTNADMMFVNGSDCKIDFVRGPLTNFASSASIEGRQKVIVIDEFDRSGLAESQRHLRSFLEAYSSNCSVIITANNIDGIIEPLRSRCRVIKFGQATEEDRTTMMKQMIRRMVEICKNENIEIADLKVVAALVKKNFPDFRKTIGELDMYSSKGVLDAGILSIVTNDNGSVNDVLDALKAKDVKQLRALAPKYAVDYSWFVDKLSNELYNLVKGPSIIRMYEIIGENNQYHGIAANTELHIVYMLIQLTLEMDWK